MFYENVSGTPNFSKEANKKNMPVLQKQKRDPQNEEEVELWTEKDKYKKLI